MSVIIPCRNEARYVERCLWSVLAQEEPEGGFEVIIADGKSDDGTREAIRKIESRKQKLAVSPESKVQSPKSTDASGPLVTVIENPGRIVSTGLNAAIRAARGDIVIRMDAHTEYAPDYIRRCVETLRETRADNAGGPWVAKGGGYASRAIAAAFRSPFSTGGAWSHSPEYEGPVESVYLGCWRREAFERFGYFDEELVRNQDDEHNLRIVRGGGRIWQSPVIKSWYRPRGSLSALFRQYMQYGYWKVRVIQKHKLPASWRHLVPGVFVFTLLSLFLLSTFTFLLSPLSRLSAFRFHPSALSFCDFCFLLSTFCFLSSLVLYAFLALVVSIATAAKIEGKLLPVLPWVFGCYHLSYGLGFLRGIFDFIICRRAAPKAFTNLTRPSPDV